MTEHQQHPHASLTVRPDQPLIGVIDQQNGTEVVRYFADEADADAEFGDDGVQQALNLAGAWRDIDSDDFLDELDRIRHESTPTRRSTYRISIRDRCAAISLILLS